MDLLSLIVLYDFELRNSVFIDESTVVLPIYVLASEEAGGGGGDVLVMFVIACGWLFLLDSASSLSITRLVVDSTKA